MDQIGGGATRFRHQRSPPSSDRYLGIFQPPTSPTQPVELSEQDIFSTPSGGSSPYIHHSPNPSPSLSPAGSFSSLSRSNQSGILAALNDNNIRSSGSGSAETRPVFNHKASSSSVSLASSPITSPASSTRIAIPRRPPPANVDRGRIYHQSAPVNVPMMPQAIRSRGWDLDDIVLEDEEESGVVLPPHELIAARDSPRLASSVMEGAGRTLKGRDLRQVRNAIWRKTGFID